MCVGTERPSQSGREHGTPTWCVGPKSGRVPMSTRHVDRYSEVQGPMRSSQSSAITRFFPAEHAHSRYRAFLEALSSTLGTIESTSGPSNHARPSRNVHNSPGCFRSTPVNWAARVGGKPALHLLRSRSSLLCLVPGDRLRLLAAPHCDAPDALVRPGTLMAK